MSADRRAQLAKFDSLEKVLRKLEKKELALREKLEGEEDEERRKELLRKLSVIKAQRKKGAQLRGQLAEQRDE